MSGDAIAALIAVAASLVLAIRAMRAHGLSFERTAWMAAAWILIIALLAFAFDRLRP